jgi:cation-transporting P-type ATPase E
VPAGLVIGSATLAAYEASLEITDLPVEQARTLATVTLLALGLVVLAVTSRPLRPWKVGLVAMMGLSYAVVFAVPFLRDFFELQLFWSSAWWYATAAVVGAGLVVVAIPRFTRSRLAQ